MGALEMAKLFTVFLASVLLQGVASDYCTYHLTTNYDSNVYCEWGCCWTYIYPCCDTPLYANPAFIVPIVLCSVGVFVAIIIAVIIITIRRRRAVARTQFGTVLTGPQVMTTNTGTTAQNAYYNPQYPNAPMFVTNGYPTQAPQGAMPMYGAQTPQGAVPMYSAQAPQGNAPYPTHQQAYGAPPTYPAQAAGGDNSVNDGLPSKQGTA